MRAQQCVSAGERVPVGTTALQVLHRDPAHLPPRQHAGSHSSRLPDGFFFYRAGPLRSGALGTDTTVFPPVCAATV